MFLANALRIMVSILLLLAPACAMAQADEATTPSPIENRLMLEKKAEANRFAILPHKPNYILLLNYNTRPNHDPWKGFGAGPTPINHAEIKFQVSIKIPLARDLFTDGDALFAGYTQKSFWQAYNRKVSSPFRDNNFNPEIFYRMRLDSDFLGLKVRIMGIGFEHESNGRAEPLSRSWNRVYGFFAAERGNLMLGLKAWYRIPEPASVDNNPDITDYLGYGELYASYKVWGNRLSLMFRPSLTAGFSPGLRLGWSFPLFGKLNGYIQYYNGYGESLIDYNHYNNSIGFGLAVNDWL